MEEEFHVLKDVLLMSRMPIFHLQYKRIRVHSLLCVVKLLLTRRIQRQVEIGTGERIPLEALAKRLNRIQVVTTALYRQ